MPQKMEAEQELKFRKKRNQLDNVHEIILKHEIGQYAIALNQLNNMGVGIPHYKG